jgi:glucosamine-6-phosphate isomerase
MRIIVCDDSAALAKAGADHIGRIVADKPNGLGVTATGNSPMPTYNELGARTARGEFDASGWRWAQLDEYFPMTASDPRSLWGWWERSWVQPMRIPTQNLLRLIGDDWRAQCKAYDEAVKEAGGFDLAVLGLGPNGHLGFNEPGSHAHSPTRSLLLKEETLISNAEYWGSRDRVPLAAVTCGLQNLLEARHIILIVSGAKKRGILERALTGPIGPECPASYLQTVGDRLIVLCDRDAAPQSATEDKATPVEKSVQAPAILTRPDLVLGVDGGNSKTVAIVATKQGKVVGWGRGGCGDMYGAGPEGALMSVDTAVQAALEMAGTSRATVGSGFFSMAGADWPEDFALLKQLFTNKRYAEKVGVHNDSIGALRAGSPYSWGVGVVAGTWLCAAARAPGGEFVKGSWLPGGGGGALSHAAIDAVYKAEMGMGPATVLTERVLSFFKLDSVEALAHEFTKREGPHPQSVQRLAPQVLDAAAQGDAVACALVMEQGRTLGEVALSMARRVRVERRAFPLVLAGGVFRHLDNLLPNALIGTVKSVAPQARVFKSDLQPVAGAVMLALEGSGKRVTAAMRKRLSVSMPEHKFFAT